MLATIRQRAGLTGTALKVIACLTMVIDHVAAGRVFPGIGGETYDIMRIIGRLAFPIFCFLLAEGAVRTKSVGKYMLRLAIFAVISEPAYDYLFYGRLVSRGHQNIYFTLLLGLCAVTVLHAARTRREGIRAACLGLGGVFVCMVIADLLHTDYGSTGVALIFCMYLLRSAPRGRELIVCGALMVLFGYMWWGQLQFYALLAFPLLLLYNEKRGTGIPRYAFYAFYPAHLALLGIIRAALG